MMEPWEVGRWRFVKRSEKPTPKMVRKTEVEYLQDLHEVMPCPDNVEGGPTINDWIFDMHRYADKNEVSKDVLWDFIEANANRTPKHGELESAYKNTYGRDPGASYERGPEVPPFNEELAIAEAAKVQEEITFDYLWEVSPEPAMDAGGLDLLNAISLPGEAWTIVQAVGTAEDKKPIWPVVGYTWRHGETDMPTVDTIYHHRHGAWYCCNPINPDTGRRRNQDLTALRYGVLEWDELPIDIQLRLVVQLELPVVAVYTSGGRSIHVLYRIDADSPEEFRRQLQTNKVKYVSLGVDESSFREAKLTRLPGHFRAEKGNWQQLLYLNSDPDGNPILKTKQASSFE